MQGAALRLHDPRTFADGIPHECFRFLRDEVPVFWQCTTGQDGFWAVTRYDHVLQVLKDPTTFSSEKGNMLRVRGAGDPAAGRMLVVTDPPRHGRLRDAMSPAFAPTRVRALTQTVASTADRLVRRFVETGGGDFVATVATPLPVGVICRLLDIPETDGADLSRWTDTAFSEAGTERTDARSDVFAVMEANVCLLGYLKVLVQTRRASPGDDVVSRLCAVEVDGRRLTDEEITSNCFNLLIGGQTTRHAASGGVLALIQHPDQVAVLLDAPDSMSSAVDELLRWSSPSLHVLRTAIRATTIGDRRIEAGQSVTAWLAAANFDDRQHAEPTRFDVRRVPNRHLTFGSGPHHCLGAPLARLELTALLQAILPWLPRLRPVQPVEHVRSTFTHGIRRLVLACD